MDRAGNENLSKRVVGTRRMCTEQEKESNLGGLQGRERGREREALSKTPAPTPGSPSPSYLFSFHLIYPNWTHYHPLFSRSPPTAHPPPPFLRRTNAPYLARLLGEGEQEKKSLRWWTGRAVEGF